MNADLHCHSVVSDGTLEPEALAARAGIDPLNKLIDRTPNDNVVEVKIGAR